MANKHINKIRALDAAEMAKNLGESKEQMFRIRFQMSLGQTDGLKKLRQLRKDRARMLTLTREREIEGAAVPAVAAPAAKSVVKRVAKAAVKPAAKAAAKTAPKTTKKGKK